MAALPLVTRPGPRKLAAGGDATASRGLVLLGHCGTPHWQLTKTTDSRDRKAVMLGRMHAAQQSVATRGGGQHARHDRAAGRSHFLSNAVGSWCPAAIAALTDTCEALIFK